MAKRCNPPISWANRWTLSRPNISIVRSNDRFTIWYNSISELYSWKTESKYLSISGVVNDLGILVQVLFSPPSSYPPDSLLDRTITSVGCIPHNNTMAANDSFIRSTIPKKSYTCNNLFSIQSMTLVTFRFNSDLGHIISRPFLVIRYRVCRPLIRYSICRMISVLVGSTCFRPTLKWK